MHIRKSGPCDNSPGAAARHRCLIFINNIEENQASHTKPFCGLFDILTFWRIIFINGVVAMSNLGSLIIDSATFQNLAGI